MTTEHISFPKRLVNFLRSRKEIKPKPAAPPANKTENQTIRRQYDGLLIDIDLPIIHAVDEDGYKRERARGPKGVAAHGRARVVQETTRPKLKPKHDSLTMTAPPFLLEMRASVTAIANENTGRYRIGLVQCVSDFYSQHTYVDVADETTGYAKWELSTKECYDSHSRSTIPFYDRNAFFDVDASLLNPRVKTTASVQMDDLPYTRATWTLNLDAIGLPGKHYLKNATRYEKFTTWLAIQNRQTGHIEPLVAIEREFYFSIDVKCFNPATGRVRSTGTPARVASCSSAAELRPRVIVEAHAMPPLPCAASKPESRPTANDSMRFVWYYLNGNSRLVPGVGANKDSEGN